jgi:hypothetical protein
MEVRQAVVVVAISLRAATRTDSRREDRTIMLETAAAAAAEAISLL